MNITESKKRIEEELLSAKEALEALGVKAEHSIEVEALSDSSNGSPLGCIYGALVVGINLVSEDNCLFFPLDVEFEDECGPDESALDEKIAYFKEKVAMLLSRLSEDGNTAEIILSVGEELYKERDLEYQAEIKNLNKSVSSNLKTALFASGAMLIIAALCLLIGKLFG